MIIFVVEVISTIWLEINSVVFRRDTSIVPPLVIWRKVVAQLEVLELKAENARNRLLILSNLGLIRQLINSPSSDSTF